MTTEPDTHDGTATALLESEHAESMPDDVLAGWKCGIKYPSNCTEEVITVHESDSKDMAYAINAMENAGYEVINVFFGRETVEFMK